MRDRVREPAARNWIAETPEEYVMVAARWAGDLEGLWAVSTGLRERMRVSPLSDGKRFIRRLEEAYRAMWHRFVTSGK